MEVQTQQESSAMALKLFVDLSGEDSSKPLEIMQKQKGLLFGILVYIFFGLTYR